MNFQTIIIKEPFHFLCKLAYKGLVEDKVVFSSADIPDKLNLLGLLQGVESLAIGKLVSYHFIHLSIQELLGALHIAKHMSESDQVSSFNQFFPNYRFHAVFQFYAAITKLKATGIGDVFIELCDVKRYIYPYPRNHQPLISILHCLCEAQNPEPLCKLVAQQFQQGLCLPFTTLTPSDCYSIGCFLSRVCMMDTLSGEFKMDFWHCFIGDKSCKHLVSGLHKYPDTNSAVTTLLTLEMGNNNITYGVHNLSSFLEIDCIKVLKLSNSMILCSPGNENRVSLQGPLSEQLKKNKALKQLLMRNCGITSQGAETLSKALMTNKHIEKMDISYNKINDYGVQHLAHALRVNQSLKVLNLHDSDFTSCSAESLAVALEANECLEELDVSYNALRDDGIQYLERALKINKCLKKLDISNCCLTSQSAKRLAAALFVNKHLEKLKLNHNEKLGDSGIQYLAKSLTVNQCLKILCMGDCSMTDTGLKQLAMSLTSNHSLTKLTLGTRDVSQLNSFTNGIIPFLSDCLKQNGTLTELQLPSNLKSSTTSIEEAVNAVRKIKGLPLIYICTPHGKFLKEIADRILRKK